MMEKKVKSMTAFGRAYYKDDNLKLTVIIRSVNGKGLEISTRLPKELLIYEKEIRNRIKRVANRGNISVNIQLEFFKVKPAVKIEDLGDVVDDIVAAARKVGLNISDDLTLQLALKFYNPALSEEENFVETDEFKTLFFGVFDKALSDFLKSKILEGENLLKDIESQLKTLEVLLREVETKKEEIVNKSKQRLLQKAKELLEGFEKSSAVLVQEIKLLLEKMDINEEIERLKSHIELLERNWKGEPL